MYGCAGTRKRRGRHWRLGRPLPLVIVAGRGESDAIAEVWSLLSSILLLSTAAVNFTFVTDNAGAQELGDRFKALGCARVPLAVHIVRHDLSRTRAMARQLNLTIDHHSGEWGMTKLFLPWLFPHWHDVIVIDTDMVFVADPAPLGNELRTMRKKTPSPIFAMPLSGNSPTNTKPSDICSCIVLIRCAAARERGVHPTLWKESLTWWETDGVRLWRQYAKTPHPPPHGDQGIYYALWAHQTDLFASLDTSWNVDYCHGYYHRLTQRAATSNARLRVNLLHRNCLGKKFRTHSDPVGQPFFDFFEKYHWHWHRGAHPISVTGDYLLAR